MQSSQPRSLFIAFKQCHTWNKYIISKEKHGKSHLCSYECFLFLSQLNLFTKLDSILQVASSKLHFLTNLLFAKNILPALIKKPQTKQLKFNGLERIQ